MDEEEITRHEEEAPRTICALGKKIVGITRNKLFAYDTILKIYGWINFGELNPAAIS